MKRFLIEIIRNTGYAFLTVILCLLFFVENIYSQTYTLSVGESVNVSQSANNGGYIDNVGLAAFIDPHLSFSKNYDGSANISVKSYFNYTATVKLVFIERYQAYYSGRNHTMAATYYKDINIKCNYVAPQQNIKPTKVLLPERVRAPLNTRVNIYPDYEPYGAKGTTFSWYQSQGTAVFAHGQYDDGGYRVTGRSPGIGSLSVKVDNDENLYASTIIEVVDPNNLPPDNVFLPTSIEISVGGYNTLTPILVPKGASTSYTWTSDNTKVANVSYGKVTGIKEGSTTITVKTANNLQSSCKVIVVKQNGKDDEEENTTPPTGTVDGHEYIDLGLSIKWATYNIGASKPESFGSYFAWGETIEKSSYSWDNYKYGSSAMNCKNIGSDIKGTSYDAAYVNWGKNWRMPNEKEMGELISKCTFTEYTRNGVKGYLITGPNGNSIFLPTADTKFYSSKNGCRYWTSTVSDYNGKSLLVTTNNGKVSPSLPGVVRAMGLPIRAVTDNGSTSTPQAKLILSASPSGGSVETGSKVYLTAKADGSAVSGTDIYYTTNGTTPSKNSTKYTSSGITINSATTIKAIAYKDGYETSDVSSWSYTISSVNPTSISVSPSSKTIKVGGTFTPTYTLTPSSATTTVTWTSDDSSVASVNSSTGLVTGKKAGSTYINATTSNGKTGWCRVTVEADTNPTSISVSPSSKTIKVGGTFTPTYTLTPSSATTTVTWTSDDSSVASVNSSTGLVTGKKAGSIYINATTSNGKTGWCKVTVESDVVKLTSISITGNSSTLMEIGSTRQLYATVYPSNAANKSVTWSSNSTSVATVNSSTGLVTAKSGGTAIITCKAQDGSGVSATCAIYVSKGKIAEILWGEGEGLYGSGDGMDEITSAVVKRNQTIELGAFDGDGNYIPNCTYYFTLDGSTPTKSSSHFTIYGDDTSSSTIVIKESCTLKAFATCDGYTDSKVKTWQFNVEEEGIAIDETNFPDENFRNWILAQDYGKDGLLTEGEIRKVTIIDISETSDSPGTISSLIGIEYFTALETLDCTNNMINALDLSKNKELRGLYCGKNQLASLDLSNNTKLGDVLCYSNQLKYLKVVMTTTDKHTGRINFHHNQLESIDLSDCPTVWSVSSYCNHIKGEAVDALINSLPQKDNSDGGYFLAYDNSKGNEGNIITKSQAAKAKAKGWTPYYHKGTEWHEYEGSEDLKSSIGTGTEDDPFNSAAANEFASSLGANTPTEQVYYVKGKVASIKEQFGTQYGNATFWISNDGTSTNQFYIYRAKYLGNKKYAGEDLVLNVGDEVVVCGKLVNYMGNLPETVQEEAYVVSINGTKGNTYDKGDVNMDNAVNGTDLVALSNIVLGRKEKTESADVNGDSSVNGTDIVALSNIILGRSSNAPRRAGETGTGLSIEPFDIQAGEEKEMLIDLSNPNDEVTLVQFDLHLPEGLSIKKNGADLDIDMADRTSWRKHTLDANETDGGYRFLLYSSSNTVIEGTSGAVIKVKVVADASFKGGKIVIDNTLLVSPDEEETKPEAYEYTFPTADDGSAKLAIEPFDIKAGEEKELLIDLMNPNDEITLVQFDMQLPEGLTAKKSGADLAFDMTERTTWRKHTLDANETDGGYRFLLYSSGNTVIDGTNGAVIKVTLVASQDMAGKTIVLDNILLVSPDEKETKPARYEYVIGTNTAIRNFTIDGKDDAPIYNLRGQRLSAPQKGINIIGGKKVVVR